ncbi:basic-leucine zipper transcription factor A-like [Calliphora vicina]|uniref:basic-leucine zipper transcription factor A-like n=1 Tax=Calliphora vicina TaxID=7373 RepID=UPI00325B9798
MERYSYIQNMPNSPLSPLTPLSENTKFEFNFGGDGSLDVYIESVRREHRVEQQRKKLLEQANRIFHKKGCPLQPKHYSEEFLKIRDVFEDHEQHQEQQAQNKENNCLRICCHRKEQQQQVGTDVTPKVPAVKIIHTGATPTPTPTKGGHRLNTDYSTTPTNVRTPLKPRNHNVPQNIHSKSVHVLQQQKLHEKCLRIIQRREQQQHQQQQHHHHLQTHQNQIFRQASPVAAKPLCPHVSKILQQRGLSMYCGLFQREEIDLYTFHLLKLQDLHQMGITNQKHCAVLMHDIYYAGQYF